MSSRIAKILAFAVLVPLGACGHQAGALVPTSANYSITPVARVDLTGVDGDVYTLMVYNTSSGMLVVDRDGFFLQGPGGLIRREPGGLKSVYEVPPGGAHDVRLRFHAGRLEPGTQVFLLVDQAIRVNGATVGLPPIVLQAR